MNPPQTLYLPPQPTLPHIPPHHNNDTDLILNNTVNATNDPHVQIQDITHSADRQIPTTTQHATTTTTNPITTSTPPSEPNSPPPASIPTVEEIDNTTIPQVLAFRASQETSQLLEDELVNYFYNRIKDAFRFSYPKFEQHYGLECIFFLKTIFFFQWEYGAGQNYVQKLQNTTFGQKIGSDVFDRLYLRPIFQLLATILKPIVSLMKQLIIAGVGRYEQIMALNLQHSDGLIGSLFSSSQSQQNEQIYASPWHPRPEQVTAPYYTSPIITTTQQQQHQHSTHHQHNPIISMFQRQTSSPASAQQQQYQNASSSLPHSFPTFEKSSENASRRGIVEEKTNLGYKVGLPWYTRVLMYHFSVLLPFIVQYLTRYLQHDIPTLAQPNTDSTTNPTTDGSRDDNNNNHAVSSAHTTTTTSIPNNSTTTSSSLKSTKSSKKSKKSEKITKNRTKKSFFLTIYLFLQKITQFFSSLRSNIDFYLHVMFTRLYNTTSYKDVALGHLKRLQFFTQCASLLNCFLFIHNGEYLSIIDRLLNITRLVARPEQGPGAIPFDNLHETLLWQHFGTLLQWFANVLLSLSNTTSMLYRHVPMLLPLGWAARYIVQWSNDLEKNYQTNRDNENNGSSSGSNRSNNQPQNNGIIDRTMVFLSNYLPQSFLPTKYQQKNNEEEMKKKNKTEKNTNNNNDKQKKKKEYEIKDRYFPGDYNPTTKKVTPFDPCPSCNVKTPIHPCIVNNNNNNKNNTNNNDFNFLSTTSNCQHIYCFYCIKQLLDKKHICLQCFEPIKGFDLYGHMPEYESLEEYQRRQDVKQGLLEKEQKQVKNQELIAKYKINNLKQDIDQKSAVLKQQESEVGEVFGEVLAKQHFEFKRGKFNPYE